MNRTARLACATLAVGALLVGVPVLAAEPDIVPNAAGFGVHIADCPEDSGNISEVRIDDLNIDVREMTTGLDVEYRRLTPGDAHFGTADFSVRGGSKELHAWFLEASKGKNIRKNITVRLFKSDKKPGRGYNLFDCFPTQWSVSGGSAGGGGTGGTVQTETLRVNIGRIELVTFVANPQGGKGGKGDDDGTGGRPLGRAATSDNFAQVRGFKVEISGSSAKEVDTAWESVSGGDLVIELTETTIGSDKFKTHSPGHKTVGEITLRGAMTDGRRHLCEWINDTIQGKPWKQMLTITELLSQDGGVRPGAKYAYRDGFPVRYVFPRLSIDKPEAGWEEAVTAVVVREDKDLPPDPRGRISIPGAPEASAAALAIAVDDRAFDLADIAVDGDARNPSAVIVVPAEAAAELHAWYKSVAAGLDDRRTVEVQLLRKNGRPANQRMVLHECVPVAIESVTATTGNTMEEVTIKPIRVELK